MSTYNPPHKGRPGGRHPREDNSPAPKAVDVVFYVDKEKKQLHPKLLDEWAKEQAKQFPDGKEKLSKSQIRRFFGAIKNLHFQLESNRPWEQILPLFKMFHSKVCYAEKAASKKIPREFAAFVKENIKRVGDDKDFIAFVLYFEAVLGFAYGLDKIGKE